MGIKYQFFLFKDCPAAYERSQKHIATSFVVLLLCFVSFWMRVGLQVLSMELEGMHSGAVYFFKFKHIMNAVHRMQ